MGVCARTRAANLADSMNRQATVRRILKGTACRHGRRGLMLASVVVLVAAAAVGTAQLAGLFSGGRPLAAAGNAAVSAEQFKTEYRQYILASGLPDSPALRLALLREMMAAKLLVMEAVEDGIRETAAYRERRSIVERKLLVDAYVAHAAWDTLQVRDAEVRQMFIRSQTSVTARHLYARTLAAAQDLRVRLRRGASFEELAREVFQDPVLKESGGLLPAFTFDEMDAAFEDAAFTLPPGVASEPIRTAQGYSIIRVEDRFTKPIITEQEYVEKRPRFEAYVLARKRTRARSALVQQVADTSAIVLHEAGVAALLDQIRGMRVPLHAEVQDTFLALPLLQYGTPRRQWTVGDFRERARFTSDRQRARVRTRDDLVAFARGLVVNEQLVERARALQLDGSSDYADALAQAMDRYMVSAAHGKRDASVQVPEDSLRAYYDRAPRSEFMQEAMVAVAVRSFATTAEATRGADDAGFANVRMEFYTMHALGRWADAVFAAEEGTILGPFQTAGGYIVLRVGTRRMPVRKSYEESREQIRAMLNSQARRRARQSAYADLAARHRISIDEARLSKLELN